MSDFRTYGRRIPGRWPGILFVVWAVWAAGMVARSESPVPLEQTLAAELLAEGDWAAARVEARRARRVAEDVDAQGRACLTEGVAALRMGQREEAGALLTPLWQNEAADMETRCEAALEWGRAEGVGVPSAETDAALTFAFLNTRNAKRFWQAGCALYFHWNGDKAAREAHPEVWQLVLMCKESWPIPIWREGNPRVNGSRRQAGGGGVGSWPARALVAFYRANVSPAIGGRCVLSPSCSEYLLQASRAHGLLGIPLMADRFIREPSVVSAGEAVTLPDGRVRILDPVSAHDRWLK